MDPLIPQPPLGPSVAVALGGAAWLVFAAALERWGRIRGLVGQLLRVLRGVARFAVVLGVAGVALRWLPASVAPSVPLFGAAVAVAIGWSARDLLRDLVAGAALAFDGSLVRGARVSGEGFEGVVLHRRVRSLELEGRGGRRIFVPYARLLAAPFQVERPGEQALHRFPVYVAGDVSGARQRIREAIAASPAVPAGATAELLRDPAEPRRWHVRVPLVARHFARRVESEVRERLADEDPAAEGDTREATPERSDAA